MLKKLSDVAASDKSDVNADKHDEHNCNVQVLALLVELTEILLN